MGGTYSSSGSNKPQILVHAADMAQKHSSRIWHKHLRKLDTWLRKQNTDPDIVRVLVLALPRWRENALTTAFCPHTVSPQVQKAVKEQHKIGWDNLMSGLLSVEWAKCQDAYYKSKKKRNTGRMWAVRLSQKIWHYNKTQWDHRNSVRYKQQNQDTLYGKDELLYACQLELDFGLLDLDPVFAPYFDTDIDTLEEEDTKYIKAWFSTIRRAREESGFDYHNHDQVSDALRQWV